jgi:hypothetical protein
MWAFSALRRAKMRPSPDIPVPLVNQAIQEGGGSNNTGSDDSQYKFPDGYRRPGWTATAQEKPRRKVEIECKVAGCAAMVHMRAGARVWLGFSGKRLV